MKSSDWEVLGTIAQCVAALGTLAAVIVSLYLATKGSRQKVKISVGKRHIIETHLDVFAIYVTNIGMTPVRMTTLAWQWRQSLLHRGAAVFIVKELPGLPTATVPLKLEVGEDAAFLIPLSIWKDESAPRLREMFQKRKRFTPLLFRFVCVSSTGRKFKARLEKPLENILMGTSTE